MAPAPLSVLGVLTRTHRRGAETYAVELARALAPRLAAMRTVALFPARSGPSLDVDVLAPDERTGTAVRALRGEATRADVVVAHGSATLAATARATARGGPPFVYRLIGDPSYWTADPLRRVRVGALLHRAAAVVTYTEETAESLRHRYRLRASRVHAIGKGIEADRFPPVTAAERAAARAQLGLDPEAAVLLWMGALSPEKDPHLALTVAEQIPQATLVVVGDGPLRAELTATAAVRRGDVHLAGAVTDIRPLLAVADALLLTSRTEGVPGVLLEAAAAGIPAVTVEVGGVRQVVVDRRGGRVVPTRDPAELARAAAEVLAAGADLGAEAAAHVRRHARLDVVADRWVELLTAVARRP